MRHGAFFDANIFVYTDDSGSPGKQARAIELVSRCQEEGHAVISLQVMQEYYAAATRKLGVAPELAQKKVEIMSRMHVVRFLAEDVVHAIELHRLHGISFWDAMIVHAARLGGADLLYSEDMQDGWRLGSLRVVNPFRE